MASEWTEERIKKAAELWRDGLSCSQIASVIGVSRCSVSGFAHRNRDIMPAKAKTGRPMVATPKYERRAPRLAVVAVIEEAQSVKPKEYDYSRLPHAKTLIEIGSCECRWALTDEGPHLFCAETTIPGKSWCEHHAQRVVGAGTTSERNAVREARYIGKVAA